MKIEISARDAKTRLPELLRQVKAGRRFTITNRGEAMADLVPSESVKPKNKSAAVEKFMAFMRGNPVRGAVDVKELIRQGRT